MLHNINVKIAVNCCLWSCSV